MSFDTGIRLNLDYIYETIIFHKNYQNTTNRFAFEVTIKIKLSHEFQKKRIMVFKKSREQLSDFKGGIYIDINNHFCFLNFNLNGVVSCILKGKLGTINGRDGI